MMSTGTFRPGPPAPGPGAAPPRAPAARPRQATAVHLVVGIIASLALLAGLGMLAGGGALLIADRAGRDSDGYLTAPVGRVETGTYAVAGEGFMVHVDWPTSGLPDAVLDSVRLRAVSPDGAPLFIGVAPESSVDGYLAGVAHQTWGGTNDTTLVTGRDAPAPPQAQQFWAASATGSDAELTWDITSGTWAVVLMDAEGQRGVVADVSVGFEAAWLAYVAVGLLLLGALVTAAGTAGVVYAVRSR